MAWVRKSADGLAIIFMGEFGELDETGGGGGRQLPNGFIHFNGKWVDLYRVKDGGLEMGKIDDHMEATWAGGTDMLLRAVRYSLKAKDQAYFLRTAEATWDENQSAGKVPGKVAAAMAVDLLGPKDFREHLFIASDAGDRLFACRHQDQRTG